MISNHQSQAVQKSELRVLNYSEFGQLLEELTANVLALCRECGFHIEVVAPILRSGAIPGCHLASRLGVIDVLPLQYKHTDDPAHPVRQLLPTPTLTRDLARATVLLVDTNAVTGAIAQRAAADIRARWPHVTIVFAAVMLDSSLESIPGVDHLVSARRTNERRTLSHAAAAKIGISSDVFIFPWEDLEEQWGEIQAADSISSATSVPLPQA